MAESNTLLKPGVSIKPIVTQEDVKEILVEIYGLTCLSIKELNGYDDKNYHVKVDSSFDNNNINKVHGDGYVLKVINSLDSQKLQIFDAQNKLLIYLSSKGVCCPKPILSKRGEYNTIKTFSSGEHLVRLLEFIPGQILCRVPPSGKLFRRAGEFVARLDEALKDFRHPAYDCNQSVWMMASVPQLTKFIFAIKDQNRKKIVEKIIDDFTQKVIPLSSQFETGTIHGDFNEQNILVEENNDGEWTVKGVLDFGDSHCGCYLYELAITMTYMIIQGKNIDVGGHVLAGYTKVRKLTPGEYSVLKLCILGRLCQSLVLGAYSILQDPENSYILSTAEAGWDLLERLWEYPDEKLLDHWQQIAQDQA